MRLAYISIMRPATGILASICITASGLFFNTLTLAAIVQPMLGGRSYLSSSTTLGTASGGALDPLATHPPAFGPKPAFAGGPDLTINVVNSFGSPLSIFYGSNAGAPTPVNNPGSGTLSSSTQVLFPSGWAGRITIGGNFDPKGSKIEASYSSPNYVPDVDISYVDGYSVPISCSCYGVAVTGCNSKPRYHILSAQSRVADLGKTVQLFNDGHTCPSQGPGPICYNPEEDVPDGPAAPFFAPCAGAAYTYPNGTFLVSQEATLGIQVNIMWSNSISHGSGLPLKR